MGMKRLACIALVTVGCATASSNMPARTAQHFTGYPYDVHDEGNRVSGEVCGINVDYSVEQRGGATVLSGFDGTHQPVYIEVRDSDGTRHITGTISGRAAGVGEVDLTVSPTELKGRAGLRNFTLVAAQDDFFDGTMTALDQQGQGEATIEGRAQLQSLPPAEAGAILPALLNCEGKLSRFLNQNPLLVRVGGPPGYEPRGANAVR
jgi:hypothetical protein